MRTFKWKILAVLLSFSIATGCSPSFAYAGNDTWQQAEDSIDYILGRPMTDEEKEQQEAMVPQLEDLPLPDELVEPVLTEGRARASGSSQVETFDLRKEGLVTSVKNQMLNGPCWAFSAIAMAESAMMAQGLGSNPDLSEEHLAYFFYNRKDDPLGNTPEDQNIASSGGSTYKTIGGNLQLASKFLSTWSGAANESIAPYSSASSGVSDSLAYESEVHLQNARFIVASVEEIKEAIYTRRQPVGITYYHDASYWNKDTGAYCYPRSVTAINHAVTIVGWDDRYSKNNFPTASNVASDGAWIVKNSWGGQSGDGGYIYISYEDKSLQGAVAADFESAGNYDHNYQYDGSSGSSSISVPPMASHANVFQVKGNPSGSEILKAVGILVNSANVDLSIDVYTDLTDPANPSKGIHSVNSRKVSTTYSGYYTFPLGQDVALREGSYFSVIFTNCSNENKSFSIESSVDSGWIRFESGVEAGQSFYRAGTAGGWLDMAGNYLANGKAVNARIKAYTVDSQRSVSVTPDTTPDATLTPAPSKTPGSEPTATPTPALTETPTSEPTGTPTPIPIPTEIPGSEPTGTPAKVPTSVPSETPGQEPGISDSSVVPASGKADVSSAVSGQNKITLKWKSVSNADSYEVYRAAISGGSWKRIGTTKKTTYSDKGLPAATAYQYRIRAVHKNGSTVSYGDYSNIQKALTKPAVPGKISMKVSSRAGKKSKAKFTCKISARASGYEICQYNKSTKKYEPAYKVEGTKVYIYQKAGNTYKKIGTVKKSGGKLTCMLTKIDLKASSKQYFKIRAYADKTGCSRQYSKYSGKIILK